MCRTRMCLKIAAQLICKFARYFYHVKNASERIRRRFMMTRKIMRLITKIYEMFWCVCGLNLNKCEKATQRCRMRYDYNFMLDIIPSRKEHISDSRKRARKVAGSGSGKFMRGKFVGASKLCKSQAERGKYVFIGDCALIITR